MTTTRQRGTSGEKTAEGHQLRQNDRGAQVKTKRHRIFKDLQIFGYSRICKIFDGIQGSARYSKIFDDLQIFADIQGSESLSMIFQDLQNILGYSRV